MGERFHVIDDATPLYGNRINDMLEDNEGYLWIATSIGLFRYDGQQMLNVAKLLPSLFSTGNLWVSAIQEDANRHLWIARNNSSNYYVLDSERKVISTEHYLNQLGIGSHSQYQIHIDKQGDLWKITPDSLYHYRFRDKTLRGFAHDFKFDLEQRPISACGSQGVLYIMEGTRLCTFVEQSSLWSVESLPINLPELDKKPHQIGLKGYIDSKDGLWISSFFSEDIIYRHHTQKEWQSIVLPSHKEIKRKENGQIYNSIRHLAEDINGDMWIATDHRGLFLYTSSTGTLQQFVHNPDDENTIASNNVLKVLVDHHGTLWVGYHRLGLSYYHKNRDIMKRHIMPYGDVTALLSDNEGERWIGTDGHGLWKQGRNGEITRMMAIPDILITDLQRDQHGHIWVATYDQGLYEIEKQGGKTHHYTASEGQLPHDGASRIVFDSNDCLWVCSTVGTLYKYDSNQHHAYTYYYNTGAPICGEAIGYDQRSDRILVGAYQNVWTHDNKNDSAYILTRPRSDLGLLPDSVVTNIWTSSHSPLIWMSHREGLSVWDTQADTLYVLTPAEYILLPQNIQSICEDNAHQLWVTGTTAIAVVQPKRTEGGSLEFHVSNLPVGNQLSGQLYNLHAISTEPWGTILLGNTEGYTELLGPSFLTPTSKSDRPKISTVQLGDSIIHLSPLASGKQTLVLEHEHQPLKIHFYSGNLLNTANVIYSYRIKELYPTDDKNEGWTETPLNSQTFHSFPPGSYTLELRVMGANGEWLSADSLQIIVKHPWWSSVVMRYVYCLTAILLIALVYWLTRRHQNKRLAEERENLIREHESQISQLTITPLDEQFLSRIIDIVDEHLADSDFGVEALAESANVSRSLLYKKLMSITGQSPINFIRRLRMKRAAYMLENSQLQVSEIAYQVGFNTIKTFTENFKQVYGMSPSDYRKKNSVAK